VILPHRAARMLSAASCLALMGFWSSAVAAAEEPAPTIFFQSHRGAVDEAPENTLAAVEHAWSVPGAVPEVDLRTTRDGVIVCIHDATPARTTDATGALAETKIDALDYEQLRTLDAGIRFGEEFKGTPVPALEEIFIRMVRRPERQLYLDVKAVELEKLAGVINQYNLREQVIFVHGMPAMCRKLSGLWPGARVMTWIGDEPEALKRRFEKMAAQDFFGVKQLQFHLKTKETGPPLVYALEDDYIKSCAEQLKATGIALQLRPFDFDAASLRRLTGLGVQWYVTDAPAKFHEAVKEALTEEAP
jgi:glycerophosphoryl diester phosphodiesterase